MTPKSPAGEVRACVGEPDRAEDHGGPPQPIWAMMPQVDRVAAQPADVQQPPQRGDEVGA